MSLSRRHARAVRTPFTARTRLVDVGHRQPASSASPARRCRVSAAAYLRGLTSRSRCTEWADITHGENRGLAKNRGASGGCPVLATLRKDGSPRTTGLEVRFLHGELWLGMMPEDSLKALDLRRDPRFALQATPGRRPRTGGGETTAISGRAIEVGDPATKAASTPERGGTAGAVPPLPHRADGGRDATYVEDDTYLVVRVLAAWRADAHAQADERRHRRWTRRPQAPGITPTRWCPAACSSRRGRRG